MFGLGFPCTGASVAQDWVGGATRVPFGGVVRGDASTCESALSLSIFYLLFFLRFFLLLSQPFDLAEGQKKELENACVAVVHD